MLRPFNLNIEGFKSTSQHGRCGWFGEKSEESAAHKYRNFYPLKEGMIYKKENAATRSKNQDTPCSVAGVSSFDEAIRMSDRIFMMTNKKLN